jgi:hypothetical protein
MILFDHVLAWFTSIGARPIDLLFIAILIAVRSRDSSRIDKLRSNYELLNTGFSNHAWIIYLKMGVKTIKRHRSGDIELVSAIDNIDV